MSAQLKSVAFSINGQQYRVDATTCDPDTSLNTFIRTYANLRGTKSMCLEGGCGACIVAVRGFVPDKRAYQTWTVNSVCLLLMCIPSKTIKDKTLLFSL